MEVARRYTSRPVILAAATLGNLVYGDPTVQIGSHVAYKVNSSVPMASEVVQSSRKAYEEAGIGPEELDFAELPDNSSWHELMYMEALGFCGPGEAEHLLDDGATELGGRLPINASGGFASFGEAVAAQGLLQVYEIVRQLREQAGPRQVQGAKVGFGQVYGAQGNAGTVIVKK
jgi:acetyl-CoA acetyltransferase